MTDQYTDTTTLRLIHEIKDELKSNESNYIEGLYSFFNLTYSYFADFYLTTDLKELVYKSQNNNWFYHIGKPDRQNLIECIQLVIVKPEYIHTIYFFDLLDIYDFIRVNEKVIYSEIV